MDVPVRDHLMAAITHLTIKRAKLVSELHELETLLRGLRREVESAGETQAIPFPPAPGKYAGMSVRWSVFMYLAEDAGGQATLGMIADALRSGGIASKGQNFNSNVSAVLSQMANKNEVDKSSDRFQLTLHGQAVWKGIQASEKFHNRLSKDANEEAV